MKLNKSEQLFELFPFFFPVYSRFFLIVFLSEKKTLFYIIKKNEQLLKNPCIYGILWYYSS